MPHFPKPFFRSSRNLWYVQLDGRQINLGPDRDAAFDRYHQMMSDRKSAKAISPVCSESLVALIDLYLDWAQKHRSPDTFEWYRYRLERLARKYPDLAASELRPYHVQQWVDSYQLSVTSRRNYIRSIKRCLRWAVSQGYLDRSPIAAMEAPVAERREVVVSSEEYAAMLAAVTDEAFRHLLVVTWETGCRPQESLRVEARHVDAAHKRWVFPKSESKNRKLSRVVYLTDAAFVIVQQLVERHPTGPLFRNSSGKAWTPFSVNCAFRRVRARIGTALMREREIAVNEDEVQQLSAKLPRDKRENGRRRPKTDRELLGEARRKIVQRTACSLVPNYSLYALRHSWATRALQRGVDPLTVAILMGHSDPSMLAKVYQHLSLNPQHLRSQLEKAVG